VVNLAYGIQGDDRYTHVPAILEMAGVPYTGSAPLGHAVCLDKVVAKILMERAGLPTPAYQVMGSARGDLAHLRFPLIVKPRNESTSYGLRLVTSRDELDEAVQTIVATFHQEALVEEYIDGREVCIGLLGNDRPTALPGVELDFGDRPLKVMTWADKFHRRSDEPTKICPADLPPMLADELAAIAIAAFRACHVRDYARVDFRIDRHGRPFVLEINSMASLGAGGSFTCAAQAAGMDFTALVNRIVEIAVQRSGPLLVPA
jgi:D-alanine-D-alanine ligase